MTEKRDQVIQLRLTQAEKRQIAENAKVYGQSISDFIRKQATTGLLDVDLEPIFDV